MFGIGKLKKRISELNYCLISLDDRCKIYFDELYRLKERHREVIRHLKLMEKWEDCSFIGYEPIKKCSKCKQEIE